MTRFQKFCLLVIGAGFLLIAATGNIRWTQLAAGDRHGTQIKGQSSDGTGASNNYPKFNADGSLTDSGIPAGAGAGLSASGFYLTDGTNYYIPYNMFPATRPVAGNFSWINQTGGGSTATETAVGGGLVLYAPHQTTTGCTAIPCSNVQFRIREQAIGTNTTMTAAVQCTQHFWPFNTCGVGFYETSSGKIVAMDIGANNDAILSNALGVNRYNSVTSFNSTVSGTGDIFPNTIFFRLIKTGGTLTFEWSSDGTNWLQMWQENYNSFFTTAPDQWFYFNDNEYGAVTGKPPVDSWTTLLSWQTQ